MRIRNSAPRREGCGFATRQVMYSCLMTAFLFGLATMLSPSFRQNHHELQALQELMVDRVHTMHSKLQSQLEEDALTVMVRMHLRGAIENEPPKIKDAGDYRPASCMDILQEQLDKEPESMDPNDRILHARQITREDNPNFWISLHNQASTLFRFRLHSMGDHAEGDYYEMALSAAITQILQDSRYHTREQRVIDVGSNIGFFSLLAASNGPKVFVDSFEPNSKNILRFCESLRLNHWESEFDEDGVAAATAVKHPRSQVNLYPFGVGEDAGMKPFSEEESPGKGVFLRKKPKENSPLVTTDIRMITLDEFARARGWFDLDGERFNQPDIAILKVDVKGLDSAVIKGATQLIHARLIRNIFLEISVTNHKAPQDVQDAKDALRIIQDSGYILHKVGGWMGPNTLVDWRQDDSLVETIISNTKTSRSGRLNLWWTLDQDNGDESVYSGDGLEAPEYEPKSGDEESGDEGSVEYVPYTERETMAKDEVAKLESSELESQFRPTPVPDSSDESPAISKSEETAEDKDRTEDNESEEAVITQERKAIEDNESEEAARTHEREAEEDKDSEDTDGGALETEIASGGEERDAEQAEQNEESAGDEKLEAEEDKVSKYSSGSVDFMDSEQESDEDAEDATKSSSFREANIAVSSEKEAKGEASKGGEGSRGDENVSSSWDAEPAVDG